MRGLRNTYEFFSYLYAKYTLGKLGVDGRILLKWLFGNNIWGCGLDTCSSVYGPLENSPEHVNEPLGCRWNRKLLRITLPFGVNCTIYLNGQEGFSITTASEYYRRMPSMHWVHFQCGNYAIKWLNNNFFEQFFLVHSYQNFQSSIFQILQPNYWWSEYVWCQD